MTSKTRTIQVTDQSSGYIRSRRSHVRAIHKWKIREPSKNKSVKVGVIAGLLASLCCIGPIIIIFFGLGSFSFALSLSQYKPYFLILSIIFL